MTRDPKRPVIRLKRYRRTILAMLAIAFAGLYLWTAETITKVRLPNAGHPAVLYATQNRDDLGHTMAKAIENSRQSVLLIIYSLSDSRIISALRQKGEEGIPVKVICDAKASPNIEKKLGPKVQVVKRFSRGLMHQKILVIDSEQNWIGSANMTGESLRHHGNLVTAFNSPIAAMAIQAKAESLKETERTALFRHQDFIVGGQRLELWFLPDDPCAVDRLKQMIRSAQKTIRVAMFTWTRTDLASEVIKAAKRGVNAEVVIDRNSGIAASSKVVNLLGKSGVPVGLSQGTALLHHKFLYIDGNTLVNGSANWTKAAFSENDDCFIVLHDLNDSQKQAMEDLWEAVKTDSTPALIRDH